MGDDSSPTRQVVEGPENDPVGKRMIDAADRIIWSTVWFAIVIAFLVMGHTAGRLVGVGLLIGWLAFNGRALLRLARSVGP